MTKCGAVIAFGRGVVLCVLDTGHEGAHAFYKPLYRHTEKAEHWAVAVSRNGEAIVTLESNCMSGRDISEEDARIVRLAAEHLRSFIA